MDTEEKLQKTFLAIKELIRTKNYAAILVIFIILLVVGFLAFHLAFYFGRFKARLDNVEKKYDKQEKEVENNRIIAELAIRKLEWIKGYVEGYSDKKLKETFEDFLKEKDDVEKVKKNYQEQKPQEKQD